MVRASAVAWAVTSVELGAGKSPAVRSELRGARGERHHTDTPSETPSTYGGKTGRTYSPCAPEMCTHQAPPVTLRRYMTTVLVPAGANRRAFRLQYTRGETAVALAAWPVRGAVRGLQYSCK